MPRKSSRLIQLVIVIRLLPTNKPYVNYAGSICSHYDVPLGPFCPLNHVIVCAIVSGGWSKYLGISPCCYSLDIIHTLGILIAL